MQVLYFMPQIRAYFLEAVPDASKEFSLSDELALLFRMLASESGHACQATNLLRALRQSREATALGLLEGHAQKGAPGADVEVLSSRLIPFILFSKPMKPWEWADLLFVYSSSFSPGALLWDYLPKNEKYFPWPQGWEKKWRIWDIELLQYSLVEKSSCVYSLLYLDIQFLFTFSLPFLQD